MPVVNGEPPIAPQISLVMPVLNGERFIAAALDSVPAGADGLSFELILADGGSDDATLTIAAKYPFVRILNGPDRGLYDGLNRAISKARGAFVALLNSDDALHAGGLAKLFSAAQRHGADMAMGGVSYGANLNGGEFVYPRTSLSVEGLAFGIPAINARLFRAAVFREAGPFRTDLGVGADREFLARMHIGGTRGVAVSAPVYHYRTHDGSLTLAGDGAARRRIWRSDTEVLRTILQMPGLEKHHARASARGLALLRAKQSAGRWWAREETEAAPGSALSFADGVRLPAAVVRWLAWRGQLSGY